MGSSTSFVNFLFYIFKNLLIQTLSPYRGTSGTSLVSGLGFIEPTRTSPTMHHGWVVISVMDPKYFTV
jgi:hypothetical protein